MARRSYHVNLSLRFLTLVGFCTCLAFRDAQRRWSICAGRACRIRRLDAFPCGGAPNPCRSISFGIANANPGGAIVVAPAIRRSRRRGSEVGFGCQCMKRVNKACADLLNTPRGRHRPEPITDFITVLITANNAQLARVDHGFLPSEGAVEIVAGVQRPIDRPSSDLLTGSYMGNRQIGDGSQIGTDPSVPFARQASSRVFRRRMCAS
jgi:hypothetical protein